MQFPSVDLLERLWKDSERLRGGRDINLRRCVSFRAGICPGTSGLCLGSLPLLDAPFADAWQSTHKSNTLVTFASFLRERTMRIVSAEDVSERQEL